MARKLGVGIAAYSPLGRGFLSRTFTKKEEVNDWRQKMPRFSEENFVINAKKCEELEKYSQYKGVTPAQLELAWVHKRGLDVFPIQENSKLHLLIQLRRNAKKLIAQFQMHLDQDMTKKNEIYPFIWQHLKNKNIKHYKKA